MTLTVNEGGVGGEVFFFKNYSVIPNFIYSHVPCMAIKTKEQDARMHHRILYSVEASGYGHLFRVSFLLIPPFSPIAPSPEKQRSDLNVMARKV